MRRNKALLVTLRSRDASLVEITLGDNVQLDRVIATATGSVAERHGPLLAPCRARLALAPGVYCFKTLSPAHLRVVYGDVDVTTGDGTKDLPPPPIDTTPPPRGDPPSLLVPTARGDDPPGVAPTLTIE